MIKAAADDRIGFSALRYRLATVSSAQVFFPNRRNFSVALAEAWLLLNRIVVFIELPNVTNNHACSLSIHRASELPPAIPRAPTNIQKECAVAVLLYLLG